MKAKKKRMEDEEEEGGAKKGMETNLEYGNHENYYGSMEFFYGFL